MDALDLPEATAEATPAEEVPPLAAEATVATAETAPAGALPLPIAAAAEAAPSVNPWFVEFANSKGVPEFAEMLTKAGLTNFVESCETPLTIFAPSNQAIQQLAAQPKGVPTDVQLLRELVCVHVTMGNLSREELQSTRSITTIGQQTHHVQVGEDGGDGPPSVQVGTMSLVTSDIALPDGRGMMHVVDCVMCCMRLLQNCRFEQVCARARHLSPP